MMRIALMALGLAFSPAGAASDGGAGRANAEGVPLLAPARGRPALDARVVDARGVAINPRTENPATWSAHLAVDAEGLWLVAHITDAELGAQDALNVTLEFPAAASGTRTFRFGPDGLKSSRPEDATPAFAQRRVRARVTRSNAGFTLDAHLPLESFPRFPLEDDFLAQLCLTYEDVPKAGGVATRVSNCAPDAPAGYLLPESLRASARAALFLSSEGRRKGGKPGAVFAGSVLSAEARPGGWAGYDLLHFPLRVTAEKPITEASLAPLLAEASLSPVSLRLAVPAQMTTPGGAPLVVFLSGQDPFAVEGKCLGDREIRLALFLVKGNRAERALEWPASTCALGRASSLDLDPQGALTIGYSSGASVEFTWSRDHFERTELGER